MADCLACDLMSGRKPLPGGQIWGDDHWFVEHCIGPLGLGTFVIAPVRHVLHIADLTPDEVEPLGGILQTAAQVAAELVDPEQVYVNLWSHADAEPGHIHFVVQPVTRQTMERFGARFGPALQAVMLTHGDPEPDEVVQNLAVAARERFQQLRGQCRWHGPFSGPP
jgi:diadenosine tetraphosphate (Ap4A) HIT family hydrolase